MTIDLKKYYSKSGNYLKEHKEYYSKEQLNKDIDFIINALKLKKSDKILDLACGHGRHTIELSKAGFDIEGLDFSNYLITLARKQARNQNLHINFYHQDIHKISLPQKYDKIFLFFSEFGCFDPNKVLANINRLLKKDGLFLLDYDNVFRLIQKLARTSNSKYKFDFINMELKEKGIKNVRGVKYYIFPELIRLFKNHKLKVIAVYGGYDGRSPDINSRRIIMVGKKFNAVG